MTRKKTTSTPKPTDIPASREGLDHEIELLRELIRKAGEKQSEGLEFDEQLDLLETVGRTAPALARLLKARRDLENEELDPGAMLKQALIELEEEWPELKRFGEKLGK